MTNKYTVREKRLLRELDIPDFNHLTKDKLVMFRSSLERLSPEVAKAIIEKIPDAIKSSVEYVSIMGDYADKILDNDKGSTDKINSHGKNNGFNWKCHISCIGIHSLNFCWEFFG